MSGSSELHRPGASARHAPRRSAKSPRKPAAALGTLIPRLTKKAFERHGFAAATLITDWTVIVGQATATKCQPMKVKWPRTGTKTAPNDDTPRPGGRLVLGVEPAHALEIQYNTDQIRERINRHYGYRAIETVHIVQLAAQSSSAANISAETQRCHGARKNNAAPVLTPDAVAAVADLPNARVRDALMRLSDRVAGESARNRSNHSAT
ncbi:MAG: DUF721 domain-containing protein [Pseudomonadota bacterium]